MHTTTRLVSACLMFAVSAGMLSACSSYGGSGAKSGSMAPARMENGSLVGANGMTLYVFDKDADGKSMCNGKCAENWPPLMVSQGQGQASGDFSVIARDDGSRQYAYKGKPLYYWVKDQKPGDRSGDGVNNVWHVAR